MTLKEAYKILGASKENTDREIKAKYKKLLVMYHPDSDPTRKRDPEDDEKIRQVIEAYRKIREFEGEPYFEPYEFTWDALENKRAFSERNIFFQFKIYDEALPPSKMARGRFVWDPDMEEFPLFAKSVLEACKEVMTDHDFTPAPDKVKDIFHLMMQEYVLPADAARKIGKMIREDGDREVYSFSGFIKDEPGTRRESKINCGEPLNIYLREDRAVVEEIVTGRILGSISFDEDELYYVVLPLLEDPKVDALATITKVDRSRRNKERISVAIELTIPKDLMDTPVLNGQLIKELLMK
ncbi:MAG: DnaJ domain-containing protein [Butyrivibrio sp.]|uniref:DnaJ domain-containing protein n=1 Tax=Butyrivibrio sp. TaxID=28121 RepID=UPI001B73CCBA|nr:DnaJ domain-containing protein [Butyrivibrio sp.]MBP3781848.1 DnaJ domain-containing protein [Butyrivibrio sp.]MBP3814771.1 DnaJ domain-containing protein [Butyrivibrio sp.]